MMNCAKNTPFPTRWLWLSITEQMRTQDDVACGIFGAVLIFGASPLPAFQTTTSNQPTTLNHCTIIASKSNRTAQHS
eukprot:scaffold36419_cov161-Skeletonema_dohrnii-CCMP3373.AAC.2